MNFIIEFGLLGIVVFCGAAGKALLQKKTTKVPRQVTVQKVKRE